MGVAHWTYLVGVEERGRRGAIGKREARADRKFLGAMSFVPAPIAPEDIAVTGQSHERRSPPARRHICRGVTDRGPKAKSDRATEQARSLG
jgi:hypothetical protein